MPPRGFRSSGLFAPRGKSGPEGADHGANDGIIERATVYVHSFENGEAVQGCEQGQGHGPHVLVETIDTG
jgi:hypothetical protein